MYLLRGVRMLKKYSILPFLSCIGLCVSIQAADVMSEIQTLNGQRALFNATSTKLGLLVGSLDNSSSANPKSKTALVNVLNDTMISADNYSKNCEKIKERIALRAQSFVESKLQREAQVIDKDLSQLKLSEESQPQEYAMAKKAIEYKHKMSTCTTLAAILSGSLQSQAGQDE